MRQFHIENGERIPRFIHAVSGASAVQVLHSTSYTISLANLKVLVRVASPDGRQVPILYWVPRSLTPSYFARAQLLTASYLTQMLHCT